MNFEKKSYKEMITYENIIYKKIEEENLTLDIICPPQTKFKKNPVIIYVPGGAFCKCDKSSLVKNERNTIVQNILNNGYSIIAVSYTICDGNKVFPQNIIDVKDSIRWVYKNANKYKLDINNIGIWGSSAGGDLALVAAYTEDEKFKDENELASYSSKVNYVIDLNASSSFYDLIKNDKNYIEKANILLGKNLIINTNEKEKINSYTPIYNTHKNCPPTLIIHGTIDNIVPIIHSKKLYMKLIESGNDAEYIELKDVGHGLSNISEEKLNILSIKIIDFLKKWYNEENQGGK